MSEQVLCKVRFDGSHYLVSPYENDSEFTVDEIINLPKNKLGLNDKDKKMDLFYSDYAVKNYGDSTKGKRTNYLFLKQNDIQLTEYLNNIYLNIKDKVISKDDLHFRLWAAACSDDELMNKCSFDSSTIWFYKFVKKFVDRKAANDLNRKLRFKRKAYNNEWNYFCTFTYNDALCTEEEFIKKLKNKLQNLHSKKGWLYMGTFERGSRTNRLHFHAIVYVPDGSMPGKIRKDKSWDNRNHKIVDVFCNEDFEKKIGYNDFKSISKHDISFDDAVSYVIKYITKTNDKIVYSRGLKDVQFGYGPVDDHIICNYNKTSPYFIVDDNFVSKFKELAVNVLN